MRRFLMLACMLAAACGGDSVTGPNASFVGHWDLISVNGQTLPATVAFSGFTDVVYAREIALFGNGTSGFVTDSAATTLECVSPTPCVGSGSQLVSSWTVAGDELTVFVASPIGGFSNILTLTRQSDGTLLETDQGETDVYRKE